MTIHRKFKNRQKVIYTANHSDMAKDTKVYNEQNSLNYIPRDFALSQYINYATIFRNLHIIKANKT